MDLQNPKTKLLITSAAAVVALSSTWLALGFIIGLAGAPTEGQKSFTGGIVWIVMSLLLIAVTGIAVYFLWKKRCERLKEEALRQDKEKGSVESSRPPGSSGTTANETIRTQVTKQSEDHGEDPFKTPRGGKKSVVLPVSITRAPAHVVGGVELQPLAELSPDCAICDGHATPPDANARTPTKNLQPASDGYFVHASPPAAHAQTIMSSPPPVESTNAPEKIDPVVYFGQRARSRPLIANEQQSESLMGPRIDSEFWRRVEQLEPKSTAAAATPLRHARSASQMKTNNDLSNPMTPARNSISLVSSDPTSSRISTRFSNATRRAVAYMTGSPSAEDQSHLSVSDADAPRPLSTVFPKRGSSLGAPISPARLNVEESAPNFSVLRSPSRPNSTRVPNDNERPLSQVIDMYAALGDSTRPSMESAYSITEDEHFVMANPKRSTEGPPVLSRQLFQQKLLDAERLRRDSNTLPRLPSASQASFATKISATSSDGEPFYYDQSKFNLSQEPFVPLEPPNPAFQNNGIFAPRSTSDSHMSDSTIRPLPIAKPSGLAPPNPGGLVPSQSIMTLASSPSSTFEPSLVSSQIMLTANGMTASPSTQSLADHRSTTAIHLSSLVGPSHSNTDANIFINSETPIFPGSSVYTEGDSTLGPLPTTTTSSTPERPHYTRSLASSRKGSDDLISFKSARTSIASTVTTVPASSDKTAAVKAVDGGAAAGTKQKDLLTGADAKNNEDSGEWSGLNLYEGT